MRYTLIFLIMLLVPTLTFAITLSPDPITSRSEYFEVYCDLVDDTHEYAFFDLRNMEEDGGVYITGYLACDTNSAMFAGIDSFASPEQFEFSGTYGLIEYEAGSTLAGNIDTKTFATADTETGYIGSGEFQYIGGASEDVTETASEPAIAGMWLTSWLIMNLVLLVLAMGVIFGFAFRFIRNNT